MRWLVLCCGLMLGCWSATAQAQIPAPGDDKAIREVIEAQIDAFRRDDGRAAFALAAPQVQQQFGDPDTFMAMVRNGYQAVYRPSQVEFEELGIVQGMLAQRVHVVGPDGVPRWALYFMQRMGDGIWRIAGCILLEEPGRGT